MNVNEPRAKRKNKLMKKKINSSIRTEYMTNLFEKFV